MIKRGDEVDRIVNELSQEIPVVLNRNPTLHALSMQAFYPKPVNHLAIEVNPLTLKAFGGDVDGDQIALFVPITDESISEVKERMIGKNSFNLSNMDVTVSLFKELGMSIYLFTISEDTGDEILTVNDQLESNLYRYGSYKKCL